MAQRGMPSVAHEYDEKNQCKYCGTYKVSVEKMSLVCTPAREAEADKMFEDTQTQNQEQEKSTFKAVPRKSNYGK